MNENDAASSSTALWASWAFVGLPLAWGMIMTLRSALALFG